jgi:Ni/Co efflux regulator RcnB
MEDLEMRNLVLAIVGLGVVAVALPVASANAEETVVIKKNRHVDRDWHRHYDMDRNRHYHKKVVIEKDRRYHD